MPIRPLAMTYDPSRDELAAADAFLAFARTLLERQAGADVSPRALMDVYVQLGADGMVRGGVPPSTVITGLARGVASTFARIGCDSGQLDVCLAAFSASVREAFLMIANSEAAENGPVGHA